MSNGQNIVKFRIVKFSCLRALISDRGQLNLNVVNLDFDYHWAAELENKNKAIEYFRIYGGWEIWLNIQMRYNKPAQVNAGGRVYTRLAFILMEQQQNNFFC